MNRAKRGKYAKFCFAFLCYYFCTVFCPDGETCLPAGRLVDTREKMFTVYAIRSKIRNYIYVGLTGDLTSRINRHNKGQNKTTSSYAPFELLYTEEFENRIDARKREKYLKSGVGKVFLKRKL